MTFATAKKTFTLKKAQFVKITTRYLVKNALSKDIKQLWFLVWCWGTEMNIFWEKNSHFYCQAHLFSSTFMNVPWPFSFCVCAVPKDNRILRRGACHVFCHGNGGFLEQTCVALSRENCFIYLKRKIFTAGQWNWTRWEEDIQLDSNKIVQKYVSRCWKATWRSLERATYYVLQRFTGSNSIARWKDI